MLESINVVLDVLAYICMCNFSITVFNKLVCLLQLMTEKGNHIKVRRQLEQVTSEHTQLVADSARLRDDGAKLTSDAETFAAREMELKMTVERLTAELRAASVDRDRLARELEDRRDRDVAVQDNIEVSAMSLPLAYTRACTPVAVSYALTAG